MIQGIFYARFLPQEGTKVVAQSPPGCIVAEPDSPGLRPPLLDFDIIQEYIIPRKAFFNRLMTVNSPDGKYSVLGLPVCIPNEHYNRNEFIFNFGLVVESDVDQMAYERLVRRLAITFTEMERQGAYLSASEGEHGEQIPLDDGRRPIGSLLEIVKEDLNNYGECMIPVDEANTINMKLFPYHTPPALVKGWHVPVLKMKLSEILDPSWDLTLQKIIPHIDGVNDVRRIAWLADVSLPLTQIALQHLLYYDTILLLDIFFFGSCYAPRPGIHDFIVNRDGIIEECMGYVCIGPGPVAGGSTSKSGESRPHRERDAVSKTSEDPAEEVSLGTPAFSSTIKPTTSMPPHSSTTSTPGHSRAPSGQGDHTATPSRSRSGSASKMTHYRLIKLMTTFCVGRSVMEWIKLHQDHYGFDVLRYVDVRRLVQFGVIKGLLYRVHKYAASTEYLNALATGRLIPPPSPSATEADCGGGGGGGGPPQRGTDEQERSSVTDQQPSPMTAASSRNSSNATLKIPSSRSRGDGRSSTPSSHAAPHRRRSLKAPKVKSKSKLTLALNDDGETSHEEDEGDEDEGGNGGSGSNNRNHNHHQQKKQQQRTTPVPVPEMADPWQRYADGRHCFDQIITEQNMTDSEILDKLRGISLREGGGMPDLNILYR